MNRRWLRITPGFVFVVSFGCYFGSVRLTLTVLLCAALHEMGHLLAAKLWGVPVERLELTAFGGEFLLGEGLRSFGCDLALSLSGPLVNLLTALFCTALHRFPLMAGASLLLGFLNLLPVEPLDGGRALNTLFSALWGPFLGERVLRVCSRGFALAVLALGCYLLLEYRRPGLAVFGLWLTLAAFRER